MIFFDYTLAKTYFKVVIFPYSLQNNILLHKMLSFYFLLILGQFTNWKVILLTKQKKST